MPTTFIPGWNPDRARDAAIEARASGFMVSYPKAPPGVTYPPALSLSKYIKYHLDQGQTGTCWVHAPVQCAQILSATGNELGQSIEVPQLSRHFVGYYGKAIEGGGNPTDGGSVVDAFTAMSDAPGGMGAPHESLDPWVPTRRALATKPGSAAIADAARNRVHQVASVEWGDSVKENLVALRAVAIGIWWPQSWGTPGSTFIASVGSGSYGHALAVIGWLTDGKGQLWWQIENSWSAIYRPLPADHAALVPGYVSDTATTASAFWVTDDEMQTVLAKGHAEIITAASISGFSVTPKIPSFSVVNT